MPHFNPQLTITLSTSIILIELIVLLFSLELRRCGVFTFLELFYPLNHPDSGVFLTSTKLHTDYSLQSQSSNFSFQLQRNSQVKF